MCATLREVSESTPRKAVYDIAIADLDREVRSADALSSRAATLIGFCGVILALVSTLGRDSLTRELGAVGRPVASAALIGGIVVVAAAAIAAATILSSRPRGRTRPQVLRELRTATDPESEIYGRLAKSAITLFEEEAAKNDLRGRMLRLATLAVVAGLVLLAVQAVVVATTLTSEPCSTTRTTETTRTSPTPTKTPTRTTRVVTISSTGCAKATRTTAKSADR